MPDVAVDDGWPFRPGLDPKRTYAGQIIVMRTPLHELTQTSIRAIAQRLAGMTDEEVETFLTMHALDRMVNP